jgi:hypothetical protein
VRGVQWLREHPVIAAIFVICTVAGAGAGVVYLPEDWALLRRLAAGAISGAGVALFSTVTRLFT